MSLILIDNSPLLKFLSSASSNFFCLLTSTSNLSSNPATTFFIFSKPSSFSQLSCSTMNLFYHIKYFTTLLTFLFLNIFSTSHSLTSFTSTSFTFSTFCLPICSLYLSGTVHTGVKVCNMDPEMCGLVEWPWLQLMCCATCLPCGCNFRWLEEVWDGSEYWFGMSLLNTGDWVQ